MPLARSSRGSHPQSVCAHLLHRAVLPGQRLRERRPNIGCEEMRSFLHEGPALGFACCMPYDGRVVFHAVAVAEGEKRRLWHRLPTLSDPHHVVTVSRCRIPTCSRQHDLKCRIHDCLPMRIVRTHSTRYHHVQDHRRALFLVSSKARAA